MSFTGASPNVQRSFPDQFGMGYPGQLWRPSAGVDVFIDTYPLQDTQAFCGRMVSKGDGIDFTNNLQLHKAAFAVREVIVGDTDAEFVGVVIRPYSGAFNVTDVDAVPKAGFFNKDNISIINLGTKQKIIVRQDDITVPTVVHGAPVYVALNPVNAFNIQIGEFANAAGAGMVLVPNAIWYLSKTVTLDDPINVIQLL